MKKIFVAIFIIFSSVVYAADTKITSKKYVDTQIATKQDIIQAVDNNTVITHTGTAGNIGEKAIYDSNESYESQQTALMTAGDANAGINNALENEFVCVEEDTDGTCLIWKIKSYNINALPNSYTQLEYLQGTGNQYINTGITTSDNLTVDVTFQFLTECSGICVLFGASKGTREDYPTDTQIWLQSQEFWVARCYNDNTSSTYYRYRCVASRQDNNKHRVIFNNYDGGVWWDNTRIGDFMPYTTNNKVMYIGKSNHPDNYISGIRRTYHVLFTDKNTGQYVGNFIPARRDSDGELGMYDLVSNRFFTNNGTGTFIAGPVASYIPQNQ